MTLRSAILQSLESEDTAAIEQLIWLPAKAPLVREILVAQSLPWLRA